MQISVHVLTVVTYKKRINRTKNHHARDEAERKKLQYKASISIHPGRIKHTQRERVTITNVPTKWVTNDEIDNTVTILPVISKIWEDTDNKYYTIYEQSKHQ